MNTPTPTPSTRLSQPGFALYLRADGTVMLVRGDVAVEAALNPAQLLQLGIDCLQVACTMQPALTPSAAEALDAAVVPEHLVSVAQAALQVSTVIEEDPSCRTIN